MTFVLAMLKYPEVQRRAQEEVDSVVGKDRLPTFEDREHLPYVRAVCTEILRYVGNHYIIISGMMSFRTRWQIITPIGLQSNSAYQPAC